MDICAACGMPLEDKSWIGLEKDGQLFCTYCVDEEKNVRSCEEIFRGGVEYFLSVDPDVDRTFVEKLTRKNMNRLPYWQGKSCTILSGDELTDEEFESYFASFKG